MRRTCLTLFCLTLLCGLINYSAAQEPKKVICRGKVVGGGGEPIAGAKVGLHKVVILGDTSYKAEPAQETSTKDDGLFTFETNADSNDLTNQTVMLAEKEGLAIGWANWRLAENLEVEITLGEAKVMAGKIVDESGSPVSEAEVGVTIMIVTAKNEPRYLIGEVAPQILKSRTDAEGKFNFQRIPPDATAEFLVKKQGRATITTFDPSRYRGGKLQFAAGQDNVKVVLPVEARIEGAVVEKDSGKPAAGVKVMALREQNQLNFGQEPVVSKEDGTFSINALPSGRHIIQLSLPPGSGLVDWVAQPVEVTTEPGKTISGVKVQVSKGGLLEVVVTDKDSGLLLERAAVSVQQQENNQWFIALSDREGVARIRLMPGKYQVSGVFKDGWYAQENRQETVSIENGGTAQVKWQLTGTPKVAGVVRDEAGKPVEGVGVRILPAGSQETKTDGEGKFEAAWNRGGWGAEELVFYLVARDEKRNLAAAVEIEKGTKTLDVELATGVIFYGSVTDQNDKRIGGAMVMVMLRGPNWGAGLGWSELRADANGTFEVKAIPKGYKYNITARADGYGQKQIEINTDGYLENRIKVEGLMLAVANLSVSGVVVDVNDKPVADARVSCYGEGQQHLETQTDSEGKFVLDKICPGKVSVSVFVLGEKPLNGYLMTEGGAKDIKIVVGAQGRTERELVPKQPITLTDKPLPELKEFGIELPAADVNDRMILVCFWDMNQRPSRQCITKLAEQAGQLKEKGVNIVAIQDTKVDRTALDEWIKKYNIPFAVGMIAGKEEEVHLAWGVKALPWLILTDRKHIVRAEGFVLSELDGKLKQIDE